MTDTVTHMTQPEKRGVILKKREPRHRSWCFTWNNYEEKDIDTLTHYLSNEKSVWQKEIGEEKKTPHIQGVVTFRTAKSFNTLKKDLPKVHWEVCKNINAARNYCKKSETRAEYSWEKIELKPWQKEIIEIVEKKPDPRKIIWYWEPNGGVGKTTFCKYLASKYKACITGGSARDGTCAIINWKEKTGILPIIIILNYSKSKDTIDYDLLEQIKDGFIFSPKYASEALYWEVPHVIVFANKEPNVHKLSTDRWMIKEIGEEDQASGPPDDGPGAGPTVRSPSPSDT